MLDMRKIWDNILDLRKSVTATLKIRPNDSKEKDFHLALAEYLHKELKAQGISASRHDVIVKVRLKQKHEEKYENIIIDCHAGKLYLRGKDVSDKYFGRLRRFQGGSRTSDAYHCVSQSSTRIINRIKQLLEPSTEIHVLGEVDRIDARQHNKIARIDARTKTASIQRVDARTRKSVIEVRDHRRIVAWLFEKKIVATAYDDRINRTIERIDARNMMK